MLKRLLFVGVVLGLSVAPVRAESPTAFMQKVANELVAASRAPRSESMAAFASVLRNYADIPSIGLTALGGYAQSLPKADRPMYYSGMISFISRYASNESPKYTVARAVVVGQPTPHQFGVYVDSRVALRSGENYDVRWVLVKRGNVWKVRDAEVIGFRMTPFLDTEFQNYIRDNGGNPRALIVALNR